MSFLQRQLDILSRVSIFDLGIRILLVFIPFSSFISVFLTYRVGMPGASLIKEIILFITAAALIYSYAHSYLTDRRYILRFTRIDYLIFAYVAVMVGITLFTTGVRGLVFGGRYDFAFLFTYLIAYHGYRLLAEPLSYYLRIFLCSAGLMIFMS
jgi:hypothetical protein